MKKSSTVPFRAVITIGLEEGYTGIPVRKEAVIKHLQSFQTRLISDRNIYLSAKVSDCTIVLGGQQEPHLQLSFINYPKFPLEIEVLKREIQALAEYLCKETKQNRVVIEFDDETVMLEIQTEIDPRINSWPQPNQ